MQKLFVLAACAALFAVGCDKAKEKAGEGMEKAKEKAGEMIEEGKEKAGEMIEEGKEKAGEMIEEGKEKAGEMMKEKAGSGDTSSLGTEGYTPVSLTLPKMS